MNIPVEVPGLDSVIPEVAEGRLIVIESGADAAKSFFVRRLALTAMRLDIPVSFVISRDRIELSQLLAIEGAPMLPDGRASIAERESVRSLDEYALRGGLLAVDSFSFLTLDLPATDLAHLLRRLRELCQTRGLTVLLATDRGMFEPRAEAITAHMADGFVQFHVREAPEGVVRFLRIPKWSGGRFVERNIYYDFDGKRLAIDLRSRVL